MSTNKASTRAVSSKQELHVAKTLGGQKIVNSGAGRFLKGDVQVKDAFLSIECKTCMTEKNSFSIKKDWIEKHKQEAWDNRLSNTALAISFSPDGNENYYLINEKLMKFLVEKLIEENNCEIEKDS